MKYYGILDSERNVKDIMCDLYRKLKAKKVWNTCPAEVINECPPCDKCMEFMGTEENNKTCPYMIYGKDAFKELEKRCR